MIMTKENFLKHMRFLEATSNAGNDIYRVLEIDLYITPLMSWYNDAADLWMDIFHIPTEKEDLFADSFWKLLFSLECAIPETDIYLTTWEEFYDYFYVN